MQENFKSTQSGKRISIEKDIQSTTQKGGQISNKVNPAMLQSQNSSFGDVSKVELNDKSKRKISTDKSLLKKSKCSLNLPYNIGNICNIYSHSRIF